MNDVMIFIINKSTYESDKIYLPVEKFIFGISALIIPLSFNACAKNISFLTSTDVPAARSTVKVKR